MNRVRGNETFLYIFIFILFAQMFREMYVDFFIFYDFMTHL